MIRSYLLLVCLVAASSLFAQQGSVFGTLSAKNGDVLSGANIQISNYEGTSTNDKGKYELTVPAGRYTLTFSYVGYRTKSVTLNINQGAFIQFDVELRVDKTQLNTVEITGERQTSDELVNQTEVDAQAAKGLPSAFGDFSKILVTLPGVASNNEFSTAYSVRGGNFDENLVYVNEIPVYRPFLSNGGQQEGLSFVNSQMVSNIRFSAGGWESKYGDKLSSSLNILYQEPDTLGGELTFGLLGGSATFRQKINDRFRVVTGIRHKDSRYLLGSTETEGQYFPTYTDIQSLMTFDLTKKGSNIRNKTKLHWLLYYGRNRYLTQPESQVTQFGSIQANFRIQTAFEGQEILNYDVYQSGVSLSHIWSEKWLSRLIASGVYTREREYYDVEGAYRICDVDNNPASSDFNDCVVLRGIGTNYDYGRNRLRAIIGNIEIRNEHLINLNNIFEWGMGLSRTDIRDHLNEYSFTDSADFVTVDRTVFNDLSLQANNYTAYLQNTSFFQDSIHAVIAGIRFNYWDYNSQLLTSPRITYRCNPRWKKPTTITFSVGYYQQFPFYRELRSEEGTLRQNSKAQTSIHYMAGIERGFHMWGRPFSFSIELYYKRLSNLIPYDIDNTRLRYLDQNNAIGYASGIDFRINGEFIPGAQSWFSLGLLKTGENIEGDGQGFVRRPSDQHINMAVFFEDHMPNDPTIRVYLNMVYGSGYPTSPPGNLALRNRFSGDEYYRADIGISKQFITNKKPFNIFWLRLEVLNALGADNTLSYNWINDVTGNQFAIPNSLSARFLNIKFSAEF